ncbi:MAG TPA: NAD-dependent epimerase/dehydratase family protein [Chitinophagaceae bacterium]|nr:NAD-dependent epimerase/dehydratase family protein [Chitinophagaceae bacterium]
MQTILGAGGDIGKDLAKELTKYDTNIRLVSRNPQKINATDELFSCNLTDAQGVMKATEGSAVVYLVAGLQYKLKVWQKEWPLIMKNVIDACKAHKAKLVFFDNVYLYDIEGIPHMTEATKINPPSKKGKVRAALVRMIEDETAKGNLTALIARSADFYGPCIKNSMLTQTVFNNFKKGKKANWLCSVNYKHSFTYTPDAAKATALLGNTPDAFNQTWHLPTASPAMTGKEWIDAIAAAMNAKPKYIVAGKTLVRVMGLFNPIMKELAEMLYQQDRDYVFDSSKFEKRFNFKPTPYAEGIDAIVEQEFK